MPMKRHTNKSSARKLQLSDLILAKYRTDPEGFRSYLPEVAQALDSKLTSPYSSQSPFGLTEHECAHRLEALENILRASDKHKVDRGEAIRGLEHCAVLTKDDNLPQKIDYKTLLRFLRFAVGKPISDIKAATVVPIQEDKPDIIVHHVSLIRGIVLNLSNDMRLVSIDIKPQKLKERRRAMRFIHAAQDTLSNTVRHASFRKEEENSATS